MYETYCSRKARPAIFYQFETLVEMSDGSVIKRYSQAPKDEIRMINDQRNNLMWNLIIMI